MHIAKFRQWNELILLENNWNSCFHIHYIACFWKQVDNVMNWNIWYTFFKHINRQILKKEHENDIEK